LIDLINQLATNNQFLSGELRRYIAWC